MTERMAASPDDRRLATGATLTEAARRMPDMARGAGGVLALTAGFALILLARPAGWFALLGWLALTLSVLSAFGAVTRIGVARDLDGARARGLGPLGFQLTRVEARLAGATLLCALFLTIILSLLALVALALFGGAGLDAGAIRARDWAAAGAAWKLVLLAGVGVVVLGTPVLLAVRLSLFAQATVGRGQMISLTATALTNHAIVPMLGGLILCGAPLLVWLALVIGGALTGKAALAVAVIALFGLQSPFTAAFLGAAYRQLETSEDGDLR